ncbi:MAG: DUF1802 family protein [Pirellulaceae bacterium]|nr:DUF1802 family protein [Pirellulaceae bacterium]
MNDWPAECDVAFKEWASICTALAAGRQTIILRKGGIDEGRSGFRVAHDHFWIYPTNFHQTAEQLKPAGTELMEAARELKSPAGQIALRLFAQVIEVHELVSEKAVARLARFHHWSAATAAARFHYRRPGLLVLLTRIYSRPEPVLLTESADMVGCKSWVHLPESLATAGVAPVLADDEFARQAAAIRAALA